MTTNHLLSIRDLDRDTLYALLESAAEFKRLRGTGKAPKPLQDRTVALIFTKSSTRTRVSFEVAITELGGSTMFLDKNALQIGRGESMTDTAKVLSRYLHGVVIRCHSHDDLVAYAECSDIPVVNALTDKYHPCQLLADLQTIQEQCGRLAGVTAAFLGDGASNMAYSWCLAAKLAGMHLRVGAPAGYQPSPEFLADLPGDGTITVTDDPVAAARGADILYTDVWVSMGFEDEATARIEVLTPYQVNAALVAVAAPDVKVMHCLPAYRGKEITGEVLDGPRAIVWDEAENRLHAQKAVLAWLIR
jgi:ornithine carbamoyltransferase